MVTVFGHPSIPKIIPLVYTETQPFDVYNKISRNYTHSFLFESLEGPDELAETSIMGFDPELIVKCYLNRITIQNRNGKIETIETISQLFYITNKFDEKNIPKKKNIFIITENKKSFLKNLQESEKYSFLEHSSEIGGRFSIFSVTGLVPAKLSGFNVEIF